MMYFVKDLGSSKRQTLKERVILNTVYLYITRLFRVLKHKHTQSTKPKGLAWVGRIGVKIFFFFV